MYSASGQRHLLRTRNCVRTVFRQRCYHEVSYHQYSKDPREVLEYRSDPGINDFDAPSSNMIRVEMMHAPWNPADVNTVQGRYPSPYGTAVTKNGLRLASEQCLGRYFDHHPVIGSEGWGRVTHSNSYKIPEGTLVALGLPGLGTLRSSLWVPQSAVLKVSEQVQEKLGPSGASLFQLGGTALRMLSDFVAAPGNDLVVQNAGTSGVGFLASQLVASPWLFGSGKPLMVSLIRRRGKSKQYLEETVEYLTSVGKNALVVVEEDFFLADGTIDETAIREMRQKLRELSPTGSLPKLALNAVGGDSARILLKLLEPNAASTMVTYGGMSGKGVDLSTPQLIFSDVRAVGYWHSRWMVREHEQEIKDTSLNRRGAMVDILSMLVQEEDLQCPPTKVFRLKDLQEGLLWQANQKEDLAEKSPIRTKLVWDCSE